jgi:hypothetical protein
VINWFKKHFIPHEGNQHRPHILRDDSTRHIVVLVLALELIVFIIPSLANLGLSGGTAAVLPAVLGDLTNKERQADNLPMLSVNPLLTLAAQMKADDMASKSYFAHTSPEGKTPWYWIELAGYKYQYAGENLAVNFRDSEDVTAAWLKSPTHKANIVKANYTEMGTGIARGLYQGRQTVFVAQVYANPLPAPLPQPKKVVQSSPPPAETPGVRPKVLGLETVAKVTPTEAIPTEVALEPRDGRAELNTENKILAKPSLWRKLLASPRNTSNILMALIFIIMAMSLLIYIVIKMRDHHKDLLGNGFAVLAIVGALVVANYYWSFGSMVIADSLDYSLEDSL